VLHGKMHLQIFDFEQCVHLPPKIQIEAAPKRNLYSRKSVLQASGQFPASRPALRRSYGQLFQPLKQLARRLKELI
jgi:hypothetical protein